VGIFEALYSSIKPLDVLSASAAAAPSPPPPRLRPTPFTPCRFFFFFSRRHEH